MKLIVLAGGFGTRLQSVLKGRPKPLADINGQPFIKFYFKIGLIMDLMILFYHFILKLK